MDRATQELRKLETFYNKDPMRYLDETNDFLYRNLDKDFEDTDVGNIIFESGFYSAVESDYLEPKSFREAWDQKDPVIWELWKNSIRKEIRDMIRRGCGDIEKSQIYHLIII